MFKISCISFLLMPFGIHSQHSLKSEDTLKLSLHDVWIRVEKKSRAIEISELEITIKREEVSDLQMERLPELGLIGTAEKVTNIPIYNNGLFRTPTQHDVIHSIYKVSGEFYLNIYNGNKLNLKIKEANYLEEISRIEKNETIAEIRYSSSALFLDLQKSYVFLQLIENDIIDQENQLEEIKSMYTNGVVLNNDVLRIELDLSKRKILKRTIENDILIANQKLNILMGVNDEVIVIPNGIIDLENNPLNSYSKCLDVALNNSFEYQISGKMTELSELNVRQVKANYRPTVGMYGEYYYSNPQIFLFPYNPYWYSLGFAGLRVTIPISSVYHNLHKKRGALIELEKEEVMHHDVEDKLRQKVKEAFLRYRESLEQIEVSKVNVKQAKENARIIKDSYFNQTSLITDLLDADIQVLQTEFELESARIQAQTKYYLLLTILGII